MTFQERLNEQGTHTLNAETYERDRTNLNMCLSHNYTCRVKRPQIELEIELQTAKSSVRSVSDVVGSNPKSAQCPDGIRMSMEAQTPIYLRSPPISCPWRLRTQSHP